MSQEPQELPGGEIASPPRETYIPPRRPDPPATGPGVPPTGIEFGTLAWSVLRESPAEPASIAPGGVSFPRSAVRPTFELVRQVGRGGMGEVWEARQGSLGRLVAVKTIRADAWANLSMDPESLARHVRVFEEEARITARLDHPNIVPVYDLGTDAGEGAPLLAMKLVQGETWLVGIARDMPEMEPEQFLAKHLPILVDVAHAVAFAHSRGIVHRDLKPAQVMTGPFGETLLMDWGLAMVVEDSLHESMRGGLPTRATAGNPAGTPSMMAPEQTTFTTDDIGTWTDVYLLGGILYFLLTGTYPHDAGNSQSAVIHARNGFVDPPRERADGREVPAELAELAMHALAKDPDDRVPSAQEFTAHLQDYLAGSGRRKQSEEYTARAQAEFDALMTSAGAALSPYETYARHGSVGEEVARALEAWPGNAKARALRERNLVARVEAEIRNGDLLLARVHHLKLRETGSGSHADTERLERALNSAERARSTHRRQRVALGWAAAILFGCAVGFAAVSHSNAKRAERNLAIAKSQGEGSQKLVLYVLDELKDEMETQLTVERGLTVAAANEIKHGIGGAVGTRVGDYFKGIDHADWPPEVKLELSGRMHETGKKFRELGRPDESQALLEQALSIRKEIRGTASDEYAETLAKLADLARERGELEQAESMAREVLAIREKLDGPNDSETATALAALGLILRSRGDLDGAVKLLERAQGILDVDKSAPRQSRIKMLSNLALIATEKGDFPKAQQLSEKALEETIREYGEESSDAAVARNNLGRLFSERKDYARAEELFRSSMAFFEKEYGPKSPNVGSSLINLADAVLSQGRPEEAKGLLLRAVEIREAAYGPDSIETSSALNTLAVTYLRLKEYDLSQATNERVLVIRERQLGPDHPSTAGTYNNIGLLHYQLGRNHKAAEFFGKAAAAFEKALGPEHPRVAMALTNQGSSLGRLKEFGQARRVLERALLVKEKAFGLDHVEYAATALQLASVLEDSDDFDGARRLLERALAIRTAKLGAEDTGTAVVMNDLANLDMTQGKLADAEQGFVRAVAIFASKGSASEANLESARFNLMQVRMLVARGMRKSGLSREEYGAKAQSALADFASEVEKISGSMKKRAIYAEALFLAGREEEARALVAALVIEGCPAALEEGDRGDFLRLQGDLKASGGMD